MVIYLDITAAIVVALFVWLVPVRRHGIPGLRDRGKFRIGRPSLSGLLRVPPRHPGQVAPRPAPPGDMTGEPDGGQGSGRDERVLAELDATWDPGYADRVTAQHQSKKKSA